LQPCINGNGGNDGINTKRLWEKTYSIRGTSKVMHFIRSTTIHNSTKKDDVAKEKLKKGFYFSCEAH
jgi:hypothetical protein